MLALAVGDRQDYSPPASAFFGGRLGDWDERWFSRGLIAVGERPLLGDPLVPEGYRFSWFTPSQRLQVARLSRYPVGVFSAAMSAGGWPVQPTARSLHRRRSEATLEAVRSAVAAASTRTTYGGPERGGRWMLESWRDGAYRAQLGWGRRIEDLPGGGALLLNVSRRAEGL